MAKTRSMSTSAWPIVSLKIKIKPVTPRYAFFRASVRTFEKRSVLVELAPVHNTPEVYVARLRVRKMFTAKYLRALMKIGTEYELII